MLNADGTFLNLNNFIGQYDLNINFMEYLSVRSAAESYIRGTEFKIQNFTETDY